MRNLKIAFRAFILLTVLTGVVYPLVITGFAQFVFAEKANSSYIKKENNIIGSELIGQQFTKPEYFWGRPSAIANNPMPSGGSNLNPLGSSYKDQFNTRVDSIRKYHGNIEISNIPKDLLFASASGVDPHISPEAAFFQVDRIVKYRNFNENQMIKLKELIESSIEKPDFKLFGEFRINVLLLNLKVEKL